MARNVTIADLVANIQQRGDLESDERVTATKLQRMLSAANGELQLAVIDSGMRYFETTATLSLSASIALPTDHLATVGVDFVVDSAGSRRSLTEIMVQERDRVIGYTGEALWYALAGQAIELYPVPSTGTYKHIYVPQPPDLKTVATTTNVDTVTPDGEEFLVWACVVKAYAGAAGDFDVRDAKEERDAAKARLVDWAGKRSFNTPRRRVVADRFPHDYEEGDYRR